MQENIQRLTQAPLDRQQVMLQKWNCCLAGCIDASSACPPANLGQSETRAWPKSLEWCYISQGETYATARVRGRSQRRLE